MTRYWKFLRAGGRSPFTGFDWVALDGDWSDASDARPCVDGVHACRLEDLAYWLSDELWTIELTGDVRVAESKVVAPAGRLGQRISGWDSDRQRLLSVACVQRTAHHLADELADNGAVDVAAAVRATAADDLAAVAGGLLGDPQLRSAGQSAALCGLLVDAAESVDVYPVASVAYIAARAANRRTTSPHLDPYTAERTWQNEWLRSELGLDG